MRSIPEELRPAKIVVVDDNDANVALLERMLRSAGLENVHCFTDPWAALAFCSDSAPDLALLDLHMPGLDGVALIRELHSRGSTRDFLPVVVLTADVTVEARDRALLAGAKDFLTKPFDHSEVILRVRNLLETRALYSRLEGHTRELEAELAAQAAVEQAASLDRQRRTKCIDDVIATGGVTMVFQPIVDVASGVVVGAEALARFPVGERPPNEWFEEAAKLGRGTRLELVAVDAALSSLPDVPAEMFLSVNVSPETAVTEEFRSLLAQHPADRIVVELTEHDRVDDYPRLVERLSVLRGGGARIAVDDTGSGYSSLRHILRLNPDILKLDTSLTRGIDCDPVHRALASALVAFAGEVGAVIIAEGVETATELAVLRDLGAPWAQGYHLARPGPLPLPTRLS